MPKNGNITALAERDGGRRCVYCGWEEDEDKYRHLTVDHIFPKSRGGLNILENKVVACNVCNLRKGNRLLLATGMLINWGVYQSDNPQESQEKVLTAVYKAARQRRPPKKERPLPWYSTD